MHRCFLLQNIICSYELYRQVFNSLNISIVNLGQEECEVCEESKLHNSSHNEENIGEDYEVCARQSVHTYRADEARHEYLNDAEREFVDSHVVYSADLEKVIKLPRTDGFKLHSSRLG